MLSVLFHLFVASLICLPPTSITKYENIDGTNENLDSLLTTYYEHTDQIGGSNESHLKCGGVSGGRKSERPRARVQNGVLEGETIDFHGTRVDRFLGIPFAKPPVGDLRFKKPVSIDSWRGKIINATKFGPACAQFDDPRVSLPWISSSPDSEDCLYLNIWVPRDAKGRTPRDVMVWFPGGGFQVGSADLDVYNGIPLAAHGQVIVVTVNYRLGIFGFFYSGDDEAPGNMGLYDQVEALKWISNNIRAFGGDPSRVTIFGESAGAYSVGLHLLSPLSKNLFKRAILQSGSSFQPLAGEDPDYEYRKSLKVAKRINCVSPNGTKILVDCLREKSTEELLFIYGQGFAEQTMFFPIYGDAFSPSTPMKSIFEGSLKNTQILIGTNRDEGAAMLYASLPAIFNPQTAPNLTKSEALAILKPLLSFWAFSDNLSDEIWSQIIVPRYFNGISESNYEGVRRALVDSAGDSLFTCPSVVLGEVMANYSGKVYYYLLNHTTDARNNPWYGWMGCTHFTDVKYVFGVPIRYHDMYDPTEVELSKQVISAWTSFAKTGVPKNEFGQQPWPAYDALEREYVEINALQRDVYGKGPRTEYCTFWHDLYLLRS